VRYLVARNVAHKLAKSICSTSLQSCPNKYGSDGKATVGHIDVHMAAKVRIEFGSKHLINVSPPPSDEKSIAPTFGGQ